MGLLPRLREVRYDVGGVTYLDRRGRPTSRLDYQTFAALQHGHLLSLMRGNLELTLLEALGAVGGLELRFGRSVRALTERAAGVDVVLDDGTVEHADLLIGADGIYSRVRKLAFGPEGPFVRQLGYHVAAYIFTDPALHRRLGGGMRMLAVPGREAGFYPLRAAASARCSFTSRGRTFPPIRRRRSVVATATSAGSCRTRSRAAPIRPGCTATRWPKLSCRAGAAGGRPWSATPARRCRCSRVRARRWRWAAPTSWPSRAGGRGSGPGLPAALGRYEARVQSLTRREQAAGRRVAEWLLSSSRWRIIARDLVLRAVALPGVRRLLRPVLTPAAASVVARDTRARSRQARGPGVEAGG